jgi:hypothetical protein
MKTDSTFNPTLWLVIGLPALAVIASFASLFAALHAGDTPLPERYHWEGANFDADQVRIERARALGVSALVSYDPVTRQCELILQGAAPATLRLELTHATESGADRHLLMQRRADRYVAACTPLPAAHWWVEIADDGAGWTLRGRLRGSLQPAQLLTSATQDQP